MIPGLERRPSRSKAWVYYALITALLVVGSLAGHPAGLVAAVATGLYSRYLYRGGHVVIWIW
jgi:hypothetical protein